MKLFHVDVASHVVITLLGNDNNQDNNYDNIRASLVFQCFSFLVLCVSMGRHRNSPHSLDSNQEHFLLFRNSASMTKLVFPVHMHAYSYVYIMHVNIK